MKLESKYFDSVRVKPDENRLLRDQHPACQWSGCRGAGMHKAPKGRGREGEYFLFCIDHVRQYNKKYNYFSGMSDDELFEYQKSSSTGHRPTWRMGANSWAHGLNSSEQGDQPSNSRWSGDQHNVFSQVEDDEKRRPGARRRSVGSLERKCLTELNLDDRANAVEIKARFKELVKRHHPDSSGGQGSEEKLREVIQAYNYLQKVGLC